MTAHVSASDKHTKKPKRVVATLHQHVKRQYYSYMPTKKRHRVLVWVAFFVCALIIACQLLYPPDRALPLARQGTTWLAWASEDTLAESINTQFMNTTLRLKVDDQVWADSSLPAAGAEAMTDAMMKPLLDYPFWQRFIPLSIFMHVGNLQALEVDYGQRALAQFAEAQAAKLSFEPTNARLSIRQGALIAVADKRGSSVTADAIETSLAQAHLMLGATNVVTVTAKRSNPERTASDLEAVRTSAEAALARPVQIVANENRFTPDRPTVASWLTITNDETGSASLGFDDTVFATYMDMIDAKAGVPAGQTNIDLTNGRETGRQVGSAGTAVDRDALVQTMRHWLLVGEGTVPLPATFVSTEPSIIYDKKYTSTEEGLKAYLDDVAKRMDVHIAIQQLDGDKWAAQTRAGESIPSASTYKLYVAKWLFDQMDQGKIHWDDPMLDTTVSGCFDRMTIASTNPCAEQWLRDIGRTQMNDYVHGLGFSAGTSFTEPDATHTTAHDLLRMMLGINDGSLIGGANRDRLLHSLSVHPYRYGIPTGSAGQVWDKVGFLWDYVHDSAIVQHPKGRYAVVIMTKGQSYTTIANLTREIEKIMYP